MPSLVEIGSVVPKKKLKMFKSLRPAYNKRRTTTDKNRYQLGHPSDISDLIREISNTFNPRVYEIF